MVRNAVGFIVYVVLATLCVRVAVHGLHEYAGTTVLSTVFAMFVMSLGALGFYACLAGAHGKLTMPPKQD